MIGAATNAPGGLELFNLRVMSLRVIGDGIIAPLETTGGSADPSLPYECCDSKPEMNNFVKQSA